MTSPAAAQVKATFIDGTYTMSAEACGKLQLLAKGTPQSISTVPWRVDRDGFHYWEGGCTFTRIVETRKGRAWQVTAHCSNGPDTSREGYTFVRNTNGSFVVTLRGERKAVRYTRCEVDKGN